MGPYLTGEVQAALKALEREEAADYTKVKAVVFYRLMVMPELARQKFRALTWKPGDRPWAVVGVLKDATMCWLQPKSEDGKVVVERVLMEQLLLILPPHTWHWLVCWKPDGLTKLTELWENVLGVEGGNLRNSSPSASGERGNPPWLEKRHLGGEGADTRPAIGARPWTSVEGPTTSWSPGVARPPEKKVPWQDSHTGLSPPCDVGPCFSGGHRGHLCHNCPENNGS